MADEAPAPAESITPRSTALFQVVDQWFTEMIPNSPAATTVEAWNYLVAAKDELKRRLEKENA